MTSHRGDLTCRGDLRLEVPKTGLKQPSLIQWWNATKLREVASYWTCDQVAYASSLNATPELSSSGTNNINLIDTPTYDLQPDFVLKIQRKTEDLTQNSKIRKIEMRSGR